MTDEWIDHDGGPCPVPYGTLIDIRVASGSELRIRACNAIAGNWISSGCARTSRLGSSDIVAYRLVADGEPGWLAKLVETIE